MENENENSSKQNGKNRKKSRLERVNERIAELEDIKKQLQSKENEKKGKARTRRLIQIGAIAIRYLDCPDDIEPEDFEVAIKLLVNFWLDVQKRKHSQIIKEGPPLKLS